MIPAATLRPFGGYAYALLGTRLAPWGEGRWTWVYGVGYQRWQPFTLSVGFANWGSNRVPDLNLEENGTVTVSFSWAR